MSTSIQRSIRFPADDLTEIDRRARSYGIDRTRFLIDSALERLPNSRPVDQRIDELEQRITKLEHSLYT